MENNAASVTTAGLQETQFAPPALTRAVLGDEEGAQQQQAEDASDTPLLSNGAAAGTDSTYGTTNPAKPPSPIALPRTPSPRVLAPDLLRGFVMFLQSIDHANVSAGGWPHGQGTDSEAASTQMTQWTITVGYVARTLTHLCAPAFLFLMGMGIAYFGRSRSKLGWPASRMVRHFFIRAVVLFFVNWLLSFLTMFKIFPILNIVLLALAFNYLVVGLIWLGTTWTESQLAKLITKAMPDSSKDPVTRRLLHANLEDSSARLPISGKAAVISFHIHNVVLLVLSAVTIWWNIWFDPQHGHCDVAPIQPPASQSNVVFRFFFHLLNNSVVLNAFPPLAWISPALFGLLYGRIILSRPWKPTAVNLANLFVGLTLLVLFVLTRFLHFGNLDEACLAMPEHVAHPDRNQYLASVKSFFYTVKYPPSPSLMFYALGCNITILALFGLVPVTLIQFVPFSVLMAFGTSALFFYFVHLVLYDILGTAAIQLFGSTMDWDKLGEPGVKAVGVGAGATFWVMWLIGLLIMWPACRWYGRFKASKSVDSLWRFF